MKTTLDQIENEAKLLSKGEQLELIYRLFDMVDDVSPEEKENIDQEWIDEAERRLQYYKTGQRKGIPAEEVRAQISRVGS